eukprot:8172279-Ditylum_brightwellii.AAC.1
MDNCFELNQCKKRAKSDISRSGVDRVTYKDLNTFVNAKVTATLNKAKKIKKEEKEVEINAFGKFHSLNVESSNREGKLKEYAPAADNDDDSNASRLLSNDSKSNVSA